MSFPQQVRLLDNSRFYILALSVIVSVMLAGWLRISIESDQLYVIRLQQYMGLSSLGFWYVALLISPLVYVVGKQRLRHLVYARRAIGVSAAYFAALHLCIALWGQLGGPSELGRLPDLIQTSLITGGVATVVLLIMALTSFDAVVKYMTYSRWKILHRLTYIAFILVVLHIWMIGTHVTYTAVQYGAISALVVLAGLESYRVVTKLDSKWHFVDGRGGIIVLAMVLVALWFAAIAAIPRLFDNYHSVHHSAKEHQSE